MSMYSKELAEAERCNVQYMIDKMQNVIDEQKIQLDETQKAFLKRGAEIK